MSDANGLALDSAWNSGAQPAGTPTTLTKWSGRPVISNTVPWLVTPPIGPPLATPPRRRRAEQNAMGVGDQTAVWVGPVVAVEVDQGFEAVGRAAPDQFKYRAEVARPPPSGGLAMICVNSRSLRTCIVAPSDGGERLV